VKALSNSGRILFGFSILGFATQYLVYATRHQGPIPGPPWAPGSTVLAYLLTIFLFLTGAAMAGNKKSLFAAALLSAFFLLRFVFIHLPRLFSHLHDPAPWTSGFEILALGGGAMVLAYAPRAGSNQRTGFMATAGSFFVAMLLVVVGVQHFMYAQFVSTLVPAWIPARLFWAYFIGAGFFATAFSIFARRLTSLATTLQGFVFCVFVATLHVPRVAAAPHSGNEWTSLFVALAMAGTSFAIAAA
jgi:uncharacterized membrane protein